jgi:hypothetical protein
MNEQLEIPGTQALTTWNEEVAALANEAAKSETGATEFFKVQGGVLMWNGAPIPNNQMAVVILDSIHENVYYGSSYSQGSPSVPLCFAFGRDDADMMPHEVCVKNGTAQSGRCKGCQHNEFGTAVLGKGKACRNTRRIAMIVAGKWENGVYQPITDREYYETATPGFHRLAVTSVKAFKAFVSQVANPNGIWKLPPFGMVAKFTVVKDPKVQYRVLFDPLSAVPPELMPVLLARHKEVRSMIDFPYTPGQDEESPKPKKKAKY